MAALDELRTAEARRMLGLEDGTALRARAEAWLAQGLISPSLELLAASYDLTDGEALRLLRSAAVELDVVFATTQKARSHYLTASMSTLTTAEGVGGIVAVSNGVTDELTARARRALARVFGRRS
ncbi:hypothetical protein EDF46_1709 [Frondihabitans sp. PhB188]|uniref:hypothetical protein n=1 Tax=Frondihabitans sp. PhB188 TaxID=2485200 RepID=UPI000F48EAC3|nr:hypothetical protein [Frondihabitans sp. PhB188]ROQ40072.1 hypothetical protein EDF46_1709 [Frondihabitans sp. PhB188]